jgi:hypothetical protein
MDANTKKLVEAGAYIWGFMWLGIIGLICAIICIATAEKDKKMKLNGIQGLAYGIAVSIILWILSSIFFGFGGFGMGYGMGLRFSMGYGFGGTLMVILNIAVLAYSIYLAVQVYKGKEIKVPVVYNIVKGMAK